MKPTKKQLEEMLLIAKAEIFSLVFEPDSVTSAMIKKRYKYQADISNVFMFSNPTALKEKQ